MLKNLTIRPGIVRDITNYSNSGGWYDCDKVRFRMGMPESIGGWEKESPSSFRGVCRAIHQWTALDGTQYTAIGTNLKLYLEVSKTFYDITPIRRTVALGANPLATQAIGTNRITVTDVAHGATANDLVTFAGAAGFDTYLAGALNAEQQIVEVYDANSYGVDITGGASGSVVSGGGAGITATYQINTGLVSSVFGTGYGTGTYSRGTYSSAYTFGFSNGQPRTWSLDNFGEDLVAGIFGGGIYYWDKTSGTGARAVALNSLAGSNQCPTLCNGLLVSEIDRHLIIFGANAHGSVTQDPLLVRWSDQEDLIEWEPRPDTTAGDLRLSTGSAIIGWERARQETLIWTDVALASMSFVGPSATFGIVVNSTNVSIAGPNAAVMARNQMYWMDKGSFKFYNGSVNTIACPVQSYVFDSFNQDQRFKVFAGNNGRYNEVWWFYQSLTGTENDRYVAYNYVDELWFIGDLERTAWLDPSFNGYPIATAGGYVYLHETGYDADGVALEASIEGADMAILDGEQYTFIGRIIPDIIRLGTNSTASVTYEILQTNWPNQGQSAEVLKTFQVAASTQQDVRFRARQFALRVSSAQLGFGWRLGTQRFDLQIDGRKQ